MLLKIGLEILKFPGKEPRSKLRGICKVLAACIPAASCEVFCRLLDKDGSPMVVYHGTDKDFDAFDMSKAGSATGGFLPVRGMFFSKDKNHNSHLSEGDDNKNRLPVYLSLQNPFIGKNWDSLEEELNLPDGVFDNDPDAGLAKLKELGYDGYILADGDEILAISPNQIKSATDNSGAFDPSNPNIRFQPSSDFLAQNGITYDGQSEMAGQSVYGFSDVDPESPAFNGSFSVIGDPDEKKIKEALDALRKRFSDSKNSPSGGDIRFLPSVGKMEKMAIGFGGEQIRPFFNAILDQVQGEGSKNDLTAILKAQKDARAIKGLKVSQDAEEADSVFTGQTEGEITPLQKAFAQRFWQKNLVSLEEVERMAEEGLIPGIDMSTAMAEKYDLEGSELHAQPVAQIINKLEEARLAPELPETKTLAELGVPAINGDAITAFDAYFGPNQWIIKRYDDEGDFSGAGNFVRAAEQVKKNLAENPEQLDQFSAENTMVQKALPVEGQSAESREKGDLIKQGSEARVHLMTDRNGKVSVIPYATWLKGEWLPKAFETPEVIGFQDAAQKAVDSLPASERSGSTFGVDVVKTPNGYQAVELNPTTENSMSGYLNDNPFVQDAYMSALTGILPVHARVARILLAVKAKEQNQAGIQFMPNSSNLNAIRELTEDEAKEEIEKIRAGDSRSKNNGKITPELVKGGYAEVNLPISSLDTDWLKSSTDENRVKSYQEQNIETPIVAQRNRKSKSKFIVTDGGHRTVAAFNRGDDTIKALVPISDLSFQY